MPIRRRPPRAPLQPDPHLMLIELLEQQSERVALELHDSLGSHLSGVAMIARSLESRTASWPELQIEVQWVSQLVRESLEMVRSISRGLQPVPAGAGSLWRALEQLCDDTDRIYGIHCTFVRHGDVDRPQSKHANHAYRIVQEAVINAIRHGEPGHVEVRLSRVDGDWELMVENDGRAAAVPDPVTSPGLGLRSMAARASAMAARLELRERAGGGLLVVVRWADGGDGARAGD